MLLPSTIAGALLVCASPFVASFVGTTVDRNPRGEQVVSGRSKCRSCGTALAPRLLVPIGSYLALRGRCARCEAPIPSALLGFECLYLGATAAATLIAQQTAVAVMLTWLLLAMAWFDYEHRRLPLALNLSLGVGGLGVAFVFSAHAMDACIGMLTAFVCASAIAWGYRFLRGRDGLGGGDVKLFAAAGAWLGIQLLPALFLLSSSVALFGALWSGRRNASDIVPFGPSIAAATWLLWLCKGL